MAKKRGVAIYVKPKEEFGDELEFSNIIVEFDTSTELIEKAQKIDKEIAKDLHSTGINYCVNEKFPNRKTHAGWRILRADEFEAMTEIEKKATRSKYKYIGITKEEGKITFNKISYAEEKLGMTTETINRSVSAVADDDYKRLRSLKYRFAKVGDYLKMSKKTDKVFHTPPDLDTIKYITDKYDINSQTIYDILNEFGLKQDRYNRA